MVAAALAAQYMVFRYLWVTFSNGQRERVRSWYWGLFVVTNLPYLFIFFDWFFGLFLPPWLYRSIVFPFVIWQLAVLLALVFLGGVRLIGLLKKFAGTDEKKKVQEQRGDDTTRTSLDRRRFLAVATAGVGAGGVTIAAGGLGYGARDPVTRKIKIPIEELHPGLEGFRIVQITDIHVGYFYDVEKLERLAGITNALRPDLIVLTGDQLHGFHPGFLQDLVYGLRELDAPLGVAAVLGNHDRRPGRVRTAKAMESAGWEVLLDRSVLLDYRGASLNLAGIKDWGDRPDVAKTLDSCDPANPTILLSHRPDVFDEAVRRDVDLVLAGHTHGGQVAPLGFNLAKFFIPYVHGLYSKRRTRMYVSSGVGLTGPPVRFGVPPELALVVLVKS